ncbi:Pkinase-domain-containing protein [Coniochaeta ligniaria NRRL 30616]|uniref:non-specific serine/threonine protein kinase n=1 Tax=Coniochaeta ligniaria NRRL 30616 TaxID=1408157 RepID=A0A1J7JF76_9PEZI|nr:Pkinase-domain-containing protein [Coniochaeta ligniaria NRRL 30616]
MHTEVHPSVRFNSTVQEIAPELSATGSDPNYSHPADHVSLGDLSAVTPEDLRALSKSLKACPLQERRMGIFAYEPYSLPASRTVSNEDSSEPSRQATRSSTSHQSPHLSPRSGDMTTPPLTPAGTGPSEAEAKGKEATTDDANRGRQRPDIITPQESTQEANHEIALPSRPISHRHASSSETIPQRPLSTHGKEHGHGGSSDHRRGLFAVGPSGGSPTSSVGPSRETSPTRVAASQLYSRPFTPAGEENDPYARAKRAPQEKIEQRFIFTRKKKHTSPSSSVINLPRGSQDKVRSGLFYGRKDELAHEEGVPSRSGSMADLKRFLKLGNHHKMKRSNSPASSVRSGIRTPPHVRSTMQIPFGDDHGLTSKYGKLGKVLGSGAGGSVRLMKRSEDGVVFAVKEFRPRHSYETEREYVKKLTAEYCIGSSLHHGNVIETLDIVQEKGKWYEVMEYAPYDLFAIVMTGKMSREEVTCCFLQMLSGVTYLHSMGLAHRDLKLDNVVVSDRGILKLIDFGSAHVFKYPFENGIVLASGIVGSDPYLAPEVYDERKYDPTAVDIWSLAIIFCCMTLRRFPWKVPRMTDNSFKMFAAEPSPGHDPNKLIMPPSLSTNDLANTPRRDVDFNEPLPKTKKEEQGGPVEREKDIEKQPAASSNGSQQPASSEEKKTIRGPWRILRLLPRESRHVIGRMLQIDPKKRAKMDEILQDEWVSNTVICRQIENGVVINADDHTHILKGPQEAPPPK